MILPLNPRHLLPHTPPHHPLSNLHQSLQLSLLLSPRQDPQLTQVFIRHPFLREHRPRNRPIFLPLDQQIVQFLMPLLIQLHILVFPLHPDPLSVPIHLPRHLAALVLVALLQG